LHSILNLIGLVEAREYMPYLRAEIEVVFSTPVAWDDSNTTAPGRMPLLEAFLRESMLFTPFFTRGQEHKVLAKDGIDLPDGTHVPMGTFLACPVAGITGDENVYAAADVFNPWRFLDVVEHAPDNAPMGKPSYALKCNCQLTSPSDSFLGFGFGRHAW
jgi:cytochrome P450